MDLLRTPPPFGQNPNLRHFLNSGASLTENETQRPHSRKVSTWRNFFVLLFFSISVRKSSKMAAKCPKMVKILLFLPALVAKMTLGVVGRRPTTDILHVLVCTHGRRRG